MIKNTSSSSLSTSSLEVDLQVYCFSAIHTIETTDYLIPMKNFLKSTFVIDICLKIN